MHEHTNTKHMTELLLEHVQKFFT